MHLRMLEGEVHGALDALVAVRELLGGEPGGAGSVSGARMHAGGPGDVRTGEGVTSPRGRGFGGGGEGGTWRGRPARRGGPR